MLFTEIFMYIVIFVTTFLSLALGAASLMPIAAVEIALNIAVTAATFLFVGRIFGQWAKKRYGVQCNLTQKVELEVLNIARQTFLLHGYKENGALRASAVASLLNISLSQSQSVLLRLVEKGALVVYFEVETYLGSRGSYHYCLPALERFFLTIQYNLPQEWREKAEDLPPVEFSIDEQKNFISNQKRLQVVSRA